MSTNYRRPTTGAQRAKADAARQQKLQALHDQLTEQVEALRTGEDWQRWLWTAAKFHDYSFQNTLLILAQQPDATAVAGYEAWKALGRQVDKGEKGIAIFAPILRRRTQPDAEIAAIPPHEPANDRADAGQSARPPIAGYRVAYVWDVRQTTGEPLPEQQLPQLLQGQAPDGLWDALAGLVHEAGYRIERGPCGDANGVTIPAERLVRVRDDLDDAQAVKTLAHELGHVRLHAADPKAGVLCRGAIEVEAESVAFLVTAVHGLDSSAYTFPYVATWAGQVSGQAAVDVIRGTGQRVTGAARWILDRTQPLLSARPATELQEFAERITAAAQATATLSRRAQDHAHGASAPIRQTPTQQRPVARPPRTDIGREELLDLHRLAVSFYRDQAPSSWVPDYLDARGLAAALDDPWQAGHAPAGWTALVDHLREHGAEDDALLASGLASRARTGNLIDRFRDRLMLPVRTPDGDLVGFIGRAHPDADPSRLPKYLNSPETPLFHKGQLLYGLAESADLLRRGARPVLVEGTLDAIAVTTGTGGRCVGVAPSGTAITEHQVAALTDAVDLTERGVVVGTDADAAGRTSACNALTLFAARGITPMAAALPADSDPADFLHREGPAALTAALLDRATPLTDLAVDDHLDRWTDQLQWVEGRIGALREVAPLVASLPVPEVSRQARRIADRLGLELTTVQRELVPYLGAAPGGSRRRTIPGRQPPPRAPAATRPSPCPARSTTRGR